MTDKKAEAKERILNTAIRLFADYGFAGVGVREIAKQAAVNLSMISYYYGGKSELLKGIIEEFFEDYIRVVKDSIQTEGDIETRVRVLVGAIVNHIKRNKDLARVALYEMPVDIPEIIEFKAAKIKQVITIVGENLLSLPVAKSTFESRWFIIGPAFISMIFSNFMLGRLIKNVANVEFDDSFYEEYIDTISDLFLNGFTSLMREKM